MLCPAIMAEIGGTRVLPTSCIHSFQAKAESRGEASWSGPGQCVSRGRYTARQGPHAMRQPSDAPPIIDTKGDVNLTFTYAAVVVVEVVVLAALWFFSWYYS